MRTICTQSLALAAGALIAVSPVYVAKAAAPSTTPSCNLSGYLHRFTDGRQDLMVDSGDIVITATTVTKPGVLKISTPGRIVFVGKVAISSGSTLALSAQAVDQIDCYPDAPMCGKPNSGNSPAIGGPGNLLLEVNSGGVGLNSCPFRQLITQDVGYIAVNVGAFGNTACLYIVNRSKITLPRTQMNVYSAFGAQPQVLDLLLNASSAWIGANAPICGVTP